MPQVSDDVIFIALILGIAIFILIALLTIGLISALGAPKDDRGALIGGLGILLVPLVLIAWPLLGYGWFP